jgi:hypothetical protein
MVSLVKQFFKFINRPARLDKPKQCGGLKFVLKDLPGRVGQPGFCELPHTCRYVFSGEAGRVIGFVGHWI